MYYPNALFGLIPLWTLARWFHGVDGTLVLYLESPNLIQLTICHLAEPPTFIPFRRPLILL